MKILRKIVLIALLVVTVPVVGIAIITYAQADLKLIPELESGDLLFQTHLSSQTPAVTFATGSLYTHVGIVHKQGARITVIHAASTVVESSLKEFVKSGWGERFTVMRYPFLTPIQKEAVVHNAREYLQRKYDYAFAMGNEEIYCSELPFFAYQQAEITLGKIQKVSELNMNNSFVKDLFNKRWKLHPSCKSEGMTADSCWKIVMESPIITPISIAGDKNLKLIYSNYWF